jgi:hypothetical protein
MEIISLFTTSVRNLSLSYWLRYCLDGRGIDVQFPAETKHISLLYSVQIGYGAFLSCNPLGNGDFLSGG